jgi:ComF family protein
MPRNGLGRLYGGVQTGARVGAVAVAGLLDIVYPPRCLVCERFDAPPLCESCAESFVPVPEPACARCGRPVAESRCRVCAEAEEANGPWAFDHAVTAAIYEGTLRRAVHRLKYDGREELGLPLGSFLANRMVVDELLAPDLLRAVDTVAAVPMHPTRERRRGFNQARLLAGPVAEMLGAPLLKPAVLRRVRSRAPQVELSPAERRRGAAALFRVPESLRTQVSGRRILLIDDVFTTGATVHGCASALRDAGAVSVLVATLAGGG